MQGETPSTLLLRIKLIQPSFSKAIETIIEHYTDIFVDEGEGEPGAPAPVPVMS